MSSKREGRCYLGSRLFQQIAIGNANKPIRHSSVVIQNATRMFESTQYYYYSSSWCRRKIILFPKKVCFDKLEEKSNWKFFKSFTSHENKLRVPNSSVKAAAATKKKRRLPKTCFFSCCCLLQTIQFWKFQLALQSTKNYYDKAPTYHSWSLRPLGNTIMK